MTTPSEDRDSSHAPNVPSDPFEAAKRYGKPGTTRSEHEPSDMPTRGVGPASAPAQGTALPVHQSNAPMILGVLGIVGWFLCGVGAIGSVIVGVIGQRKARELGQSDLLPKVAWIGGIVILVGNMIAAVYTLNHG